MKVFIASFPFARVSKAPLELLKKSSIEIVSNPHDRKLTPEEISTLAIDCDAIIAGTEDLAPLIEKSRTLKLISRIGIGLNSVPLSLCQKKEIQVTYTPDAVSNAVAELTLGFILSLIRGVHMAKDKIKKGNWERTTGPSVKELSIGIVGAGRIGSRLIEILEPLKPKKILIHDLQSKDSLIKKYSSLNIQQVSLDELIKESDLVTLHVPLYKKTENLINKEILQLMKENSYIINTARGGLIDESALFSYIESGKIIGAALDVFEEEPYSGPLKDLDQTILTQHMGSCTFESRLKMELEAATEIINYKNKTPYLNPVPQEEYLRQEEK